MSNTFNALSCGCCQIILLYACCREETGDFFAVDIGGTNYRVILVSLSETKGEVVSCPVPVLTASVVAASGICVQGKLCA